jgi:hypothetical protein
MASGKREVRVAEETVVVKKQTSVIVLELTENEAKFLQFLTMHIGGVPNKTPRKYSDRISNALTQAGVALPGYYEGPNEPCIVGGETGFHFDSNYCYAAEDLDP